MKTIAGIILIGLLWSCGGQVQESKESKNENDSKLDKETVQKAFETSAYNLMEQRCFICHFPKPDPVRKESMIAPPMMRIQEHYLPSYPQKEEFIQAVVDWVNHPDAEHTLMPGSVRKFKLMPKMQYDEREVRVVAEVLYSYDFGEAPKRRMGKGKGNLHLNQGKKWKLSKNSIQAVESVLEQLEQFQSDDIAEFQQLGKEVFDKAKVLLMDESYSSELFDQLHYFFNEAEENMHSLIATKSKEEAEKNVKILKKKFQQFFDYFE